MDWTDSITTVNGPVVNAGASIRNGPSGDPAHRPRLLESLGAYTLSQEIQTKQRTGLDCPCVGVGMHSPQTNDRSEMIKLDHSYWDRVWHLCANDLAKVEVAPPSTSLADERQVDTQVSVRWSAQDPGGFRLLWSSRHELFGASFRNMYEMEATSPGVVLAT